MVPLSFIMLSFVMPLSCRDGAAAFLDQQVVEPKKAVVDADVRRAQVGSGNRGGWGQRTGGRVVRRGM